MNNPNSYFTRGAQEVAEFGETFKRALADVEVAPAGYHAEITRPDGPSTGGGARAQQRIRLVPKRGGFPVLVIGTLNIQEARAEVRTIEHVLALHRLRFKAKPLELNRVQYADLVARMLAHFEKEYVKATMEPMPAKLVLDDGPGYASPIGPVMKLVPVGLAVVALAGVLAGGFSR